MKISMFTNTYLPHIGGVARSVSTFAEALQERGHAVQIIAPTFHEMGKAVEQNIVRVPALQNFNGSDFSVRIPLPGIIGEAINDFAPDIIHSHHPFLLGDAALRMARAFKLPLIFTHHTLYERYTHYVPLDSATLKRFIIELATGYANLCNRVIAPSTSVKNLLLHRGVKTAIRVLPTGVDVDFFAGGDGRGFRVRNQITPETRVIGHIGRLAREKNLPYLAKAVAEAIHQKPGSCFLVAGKGDAEREIREIFSSRNLSDQLILLGNLSGDDLADCYAAMDIFAFASQSETQGLVLVEAMAASTPVIALSASGVDDVLENGRNGTMLAANASTDDFAAALLAALNNPKQLASWRARSMETARQFSKEACTDKLVDLYQQTLEQEEPPHSSEMEILDMAIMAIKAEWELLQEKTVAALHSLFEDDEKK
jgi:glycosyltransferase involved in cell wall biosynthesis